MHFWVALGIAGFCCSCLPGCGTSTSTHNAADDLPVSFASTRGTLADAVVNATADEFAHNLQTWAASVVPAYDRSSRLSQYAVDGRGKYWISDGDSAIETVTFSAYKWVHVRYPWDAKIVYLLRRSHIDLLRKYHHRDASVRDYPYLLSRVERISCLTDKAMLQRTLHAYTIQGRGPATFLQPPSYVVRNAAECQAFLDELGPSWNSRTWVHKLPDESQGTGIALFPPGSERPPCAVSGEYDTEIVVQAHIDYPFTLGGKKSEIRAYWVLASVQPLVVLLYNSGVVRLATRDYIMPSNSPLDDSGNPLVHILNTHQQKKANPDYSATSDERKSTWRSLPQTLRDVGRIPANMSDSAWITEALLPVINRTVHTLARAAQPTLQDPRVNRLGNANRRFELFGLDMIFEDVTRRDSEGAPNNLGEGGTLVEPGGLKMWVTEAQLGPGLALDSQTKLEVLPPMLTEMMNAVLEVDYRRERGLAFDTLGDALENFTIVINDATSFDGRRAGQGGSSKG